MPGLRIIEREELIAMEPNLSDDVTCALFAPTGGIVCPFHMTMAFAENACTNGVKFFLNTQVDTIEKTEIVTVFPRSTQIRKTKKLLKPKL